MPIAGGIEVKVLLPGGRATDAGMTRIEGSPLQGRKPAQSVIRVILVLASRLHEILAPLPIATSVKAILHPFQSGAGTGFKPALVHHSAKAVQAGVLVAAIAVGLAGLLDVGQRHSRLRGVIGLDDTV